MKYPTLHEQQLAYIENPNNKKIEKDFYESLYYCFKRKYQQRYRNLGLNIPKETIEDNATISACRLLERIHRKGSDYIIRSWDSMFNFEMLDLMYKKSEKKLYENIVEKPIDDYIDLYKEDTNQNNYCYDTKEQLIRTIKEEYAENYISVINTIKDYKDLKDVIVYLSFIITEEQIRKDIYLLKQLHEILHEKI